MKAKYYKVSLSMKCLLGSLFGELSKIAENEHKTNIQWKNTLEKVVNELNMYFDHNVNTDEIHLRMLKTSLESAKVSLSEEFFWPGFLEGILRFSLLLMGDLPNHYRKKTGRKRNDHYDLKRFRNINYYQDINQKYKLIAFAPDIEDIKYTKRFFNIKQEFYSEKMKDYSNLEFIQWFKKKYPQDYSKVY